MAKKSIFGVNIYHKRTPKKRPGRHAKSYSKRIPRRKKYRGPGTVMLWNIIIFFFFVDIVLFLIILIASIMTIL
jgi:hypothetical protein